MDKKLKLVFIFIFMIFIFDKCKKPYLGKYKVEDFYGEWHLVSKFWDLDSNGFDNGDIVYLADPIDSIVWDFNQNRKVDFRSKNQTYLQSIWGLTLLNQNESDNHLYFQNDPDLIAGYVYNIQQKDKNNLVIYTKQLFFQFGNRVYKWNGYVLKR